MEAHHAGSGYVYRLIRSLSRLVVEPHLVRPVPVVGRERSGEALAVQGDDRLPVIALNGLNHPLHIPRIVDEVVVGRNEIARRVHRGGELAGVSEVADYRVMPPANLFFVVRQIERPARRTVEPVEVYNHLINLWQ